MRALVVALAITLLLALVGWITFSWSGDRASVNVETDKIERDTSEMLERGKEAIDKARSEFDEDSPEPVDDEVDDSLNPPSSQPLDESSDSELVEPVPERS